MFTEDLTTFFADFGVQATLGTASVRGVFDNAYALGSVGVGMAGTQPVFTLPTSSVDGDPVGVPLVLGAATYIVAAHEPDGTGVSRLVLEVA